MFRFGLGIFLLLIASGLFLVRRMQNGVQAGPNPKLDAQGMPQRQYGEIQYEEIPKYREIWKIGIPFLVFGLLFLMWSTVRIVPPRSVGIEVTFGKVTNAYGSGLHLTAPWASVKKFPATVQTTNLVGGGDHSDQDGPCVSVRLANQTTACVNVTAQWTINTNNTDEVKALYARWRSFDNIEPSLIRRQLTHSLLAPFQEYNPLLVLQAGQDLVAPTAELEKTARTQFEKSVGQGITVTTLTINLINYDQTTQDKLNAYAQAVADTRIAEQRKSTAEAQRQANDALAGSAASKDPAIQTQNCIDMTERMVKEGKPLPAAWTCLGNGAQPVVNVR